jgi:2-hydroxychromene-2-carboxylate isomerase
VTRQVQFFFGFGSRYSYLASTQITALGIEAGCRVQWLPIISGDLMQRRGQNPFASRDSSGNWSGVAVSGQYSEQYRRTDLARWAQLYRVPYHEPVEPRMNARRRTLYGVAAEMLGHGAPYCRALFDAIYADNRATAEEDCLDIARAIGADAKALQNLVDSGAADRRHEEIIALAVELKVFGVPSFVSDGELFWGNDRLVLLRRYLTERPC